MLKCVDGDADGDVELGWQRWRWILFVFVLDMEKIPERDGLCFVRIQDQLLSNTRRGRQSATGCTLL